MSLNQEFACRPVRPHRFPPHDGTDHDLRFLHAFLHSVASSWPVDVVWTQPVYPATLGLPLNVTAAPFLLTSKDCNYQNRIVVPVVHRGRQIGWVKVDAAVVPPARTLAQPLTAQDRDSLVGAMKALADFLVGTWERMNLAARPLEPDTFKSSSPRPVPPAGERAASKSARHEQLVVLACNRILSCLSEPETCHQLTIQSVASALSISTGHLSRIFRRCTGETFERYVVQRRVELAKTMLLNPLYNVSEIALRCGFSDATYFAKVFRKATGCSPTEFRNRRARRIVERGS